MAVSVQCDAAKRRRLCEEEEDVGGAASNASRAGHDSTADAVACEEASDDEQDQVESDDGLTLRSSDEAPKGHRCRYCDYRAAEKNNVTRHERTHSGEKPYMFGAWGQQFSASGHMQVHERTPTGDKPYACGVCGQRFSEGGSLRQHERTHTGEKPYACGV